jgi:hypothetical protein
VSGLHLIVIKFFVLIHGLSSIDQFELLDGDSFLLVDVLFQSLDGVMLLIVA